MVEFSFVVNWKDPLLSTPCSIRVSRDEVNEAEAIITYFWDFVTISCPLQQCPTK